MIVIADTSPINYLLLIDQIDLLVTLYVEVAIPLSVRRELMHSRAPEIVRDWAGSPPRWLRVLTPGFITDPVLLKIDQGERDAILLAEELGAGLLILDDLKGRRIAEGRGLPAIGTLGVLRDASKAGLIDFRQSLKRLQRTNFHFPPGLSEA